jgi:DNA primase
MPRSQFIDFKAVKAAITMEQILQHYNLREGFKKSGDSLSGPCPIHKGSNPTQFRVSISKNIWNCFSECKHGGNTLDFIARMEGVSIHAAAIKAIEWFDLNPERMSADSEQTEDAEKVEKEKPAAKPPVQKAIPEAEKAGPNKPLKFRLDKLQREHPYLTERGLTLETIVDFGIGFCAKGMMADRIAIPIHSPEGAVVAYAGRFPGEPDEGTPKYKLPQGFRKSLEIYNLDRAIKEPADQPLVIVEGFFDCMKLHQFWIKKVVGLMGSTMSAAQEELLRKHIGSDSRIIVMLDEDEAGQSSREDIAARLAKFAFVKIQTFSEEGQQPDALTAEQVATLFA